MRDRSGNVAVCAKAAKHFDERLISEKWLNWRGFVALPGTFRRWILMSMVDFSSSIFKCRSAQRRRVGKPQLTPHSLDFHFSTPVLSIFCNSDGSNLWFLSRPRVELIENITHIVKKVKHSRPCPMVYLISLPNWRIISSLICEIQWSDGKHQKTGKMNSNSNPDFGTHSAGETLHKFFFPRDFLGNQRHGKSKGNCSW